MSETNLSTEARRSLWQCYSLLLRLADKAQRRTTADLGVPASHEPAGATETKASPRLSTDSPRAEPRHMNAGTQDGEWQLKPEAVSSANENEMALSHNGAADR